MRETPNRFHNEFLFADPNAPLEHIDLPESIYEEPGSKIQRDQFGNRVFASKEQAFENKEGQLSKAALLVSEAGEQFIKGYPGILRDINNGLIALEEVEKQEYQKERDSVYSPQFYERKRRSSSWLELGDGRSMAKYAEGNQSAVYALRLPKPTGAGEGYDFYILKTHLYPNKTAPESIKEMSVDQTYKDEMLQTQSLIKARQAEYESIGITLPEYLFASSEMSCVKATPAETRTVPNMDARIYTALTIAQDFIKKEKQAGNALWNNVYVDDLHKREGLSSAYLLPRGNFSPRQDGTLVWIDPFKYQKSRPSYPSDVLPILEEGEVDLLDSLSPNETVEAYNLAAKDISAIRALWAEGEFTSNIEKWKEEFKHAIETIGVEYEQEKGPQYNYIKAQKTILKKYNVRCMYD